MVDVGAKAITQRSAIATGQIQMQPATLQVILQGGASKGDVLGVARIAAIQAAKKTSDWIPLCHPLMLSKISIDFTPDPAASALHCRATVACNGQTGVEMEALTAVAAALLTVYDMCKAIDRGMTIAAISLQQKQGGQSGCFVRG